MNTWITSGNTWTFYPSCWYFPVIKRYFISLIPDRNIRNPWKYRRKYLNRKVNFIYTYLPTFFLCRFLSSLSQWPLFLFSSGPFFQYPTDFWQIARKVIIGKYDNVNLEHRGKISCIWIITYGRRMTYISQEPTVEIFAQSSPYLGKEKNLNNFACTISAYETYPNQIWVTHAHPHTCQM